MAEKKFKFQKGDLIEITTPHNKFKVGDLVTVPPYDHPMIAAGQGTAAIERHRQRYAGSIDGSMGTTGVVISFEWGKPYDNYEMLMDVHCGDGHVQRYWATELKLVVAS